MYITEFLWQSKKVENRNKKRDSVKGFFFSKKLYFFSLIPLICSHLSLVLQKATASIIFKQLNKNATEKNKSFKENYVPNYSIK